jgi:hypothetical protein
MVASHKTKAAKPAQSQPSSAKAPREPKKKCGLCGKTRKLVRTECCGQWICDDEADYALFSYATNSCSRNHRRYTLCGYHDVEGHSGKWQDCPKCRRDIQPEMYAYYGTNDYNFEKLAEVPAFKPTRCAKCNRVIRLAQEGYAMTAKGYICTGCF